MKTQTLLIASLLLLGAIATAPTASAHHDELACGPSPVQNTCGVVAGVYNAIAHYVFCYPNTAPIAWASQCL